MFPQEDEAWPPSFVAYVTGFTIHWTLLTDAPPGGRVDHGLAPPPLLRMAWRRPEQHRLQRAISDLMSATTPSEVVEHVLPGMAEIVGARAVELRRPDGS